MRIVSVAIKYPNELIYSLPMPNRHNDVIGAMVDNGISPPVRGEQGFLLDNGRFVDRINGARIALETKQIEQLNHPPRLYSEDLW